MIDLCQPVFVYTEIYNKNSEVLAYKSREEIQKTMELS